MKDISFTEEEANALINLMDIAVKANGLKAAGNALQLTVKLQQAFQEVVEAQPEASSQDLPVPGAKKKK